MKQQLVLGIVILTAIFAAGTQAREYAAVTPLDRGQPAPLPPSRQPTPSPPPGQPGPLPPPIDFALEMLAVEPLEMGDPVENAPYSAEIVNEATQELPDGNRIERRTTGAVARDSRGRVRRESNLAAIGPVVPNGDARIVTISDPAARVHYSLDPVRKVAMRSRPPRQARASVEASPGSPGAPISGKRADPAEGILGVLGGPVPPNVQTESLGTKEYEGVRAEGTRTIATLPAGAIGNVRPIEIVSERWYSAELRVVVFSRRADPRFGETIYRLTNITRAEPNASLFQVPADYTREDVKRLPFEPPAVSK
jgi:hypothetical protein